MNKLFLKNPHSVIAALEVRPEDVKEILLPSGRVHGAWESVAAKASEHKILISHVKEPDHKKSKREKKDRKHSREGASGAYIMERRPLNIEDIFPGTTQIGENEGLWLALDCIQDPHNVGAIFRTAAFFGVKGIILPKDRTSSISDTVYDVAAGGLEYVSFAVETNLRRCLDKAREAGLWIIGTSEHAEQDLKSVDKDRSWLAVIGNEEKGIRRLILESCDEICRIDPRGRVKSLNASVAAGIIMHYFQ